MSFVQKWNRFWFTQNMNSFDMLCILCVSALTQHSWFWLLALLPLNMYSVHMENIVKAQTND